MSNTKIHTILILEAHTKDERNYMLVLSRKKDETIVLKSPGADDIKITVVRIDNRNKVRIGIDAPQEVTVIRSELENKNLSRDLTDDLRID